MDLEITIRNDIGFIKSLTFDQYEVEIIDMNHKFHYENNEYVERSFLMYFLPTFKDRENISEESIARLEKIFSTFLYPTLRRAYEKRDVVYSRFFIKDEEEYRLDVSFTHTYNINNGETEDQGVTIDNISHSKI